jgi:predicted ribosome-associated RNA-binding protein Tma20
VCCAIVNGNQDGILQQIATGDFVGTLFLSKNSRRSHNSRLHWISSRHPHGEVRIDAGAGKAVAEGHKSLLPVGIREVVGEFERGDVVKVATLEGDLLASGIVNYDSGTLRKIMGKRGDEIRTILGQVDYPKPSTATTWWSSGAKPAGTPPAVRVAPLRGAVRGGPWSVGSATLHLRLFEVWPLRAHWGVDHWALVIGVGACIGSRIDTLHPLPLHRSPHIKLRRDGTKSDRYPPSIAPQGPDLE